MKILYALLFLTVLSSVSAVTFLGQYDTPYYSVRDVALQTDQTDLYTSNVIDYYPLSGDWSRTDLRVIAQDMQEWDADNAEYWQDFERVVFFMKQAEKD